MTDSNQEDNVKTDTTTGGDQSSLFGNVVSTLICVLHIPFYAMMLCVVGYMWLMYIASPFWRAVLMVYWIFCLFDKDPSRGGWDEDTGRPLAFLQLFLPNSMKFHFKYRRVCRSNPFFKSVAKYFQMKLVKTAELEPSRNYMFLYHPHGVISMGANTGLSVNGCDFETHFPGIDRSGVCLDMLFYVPFYRDYLLSCGLVTPHRSTLVKQLSTRKPVAKSVVLIPGGAAEAIHAHPGIMTLHLKNRKGFIKVAMETGASLVPCLGFGENEMFDTLYSHEGYSGGWLKGIVYKFQTNMKKWTSFTAPVLLNIIPKRKPITVVVGKPIHFTKTDDFSQVDKHHEAYLEAITQLYNEHKEKYGIPGVELEIV